MISTLFQKWKNQKLPIPNWNFLVIACYSFLFVLVFKLSVWISRNSSFLISSHSSFYTSSGGRWVSSRFGPMGHVYPPSPPFFSHPSVEVVPFFPLCRVGFTFLPLSWGFSLLPSVEWVIFCLAQSLASGCLTREYYPNAEKGNLIKSDSVLWVFIQF